MHTCRWGCVTPKNNAEFWRLKRIGNVSRDTRNLAALRKGGWKVLTVWECETRDTAKLSARITRFLSAR
jgi:DNA mismatch endonuclease (patch repair protein)